MTGPESSHHRAEGVDLRSPIARGFTAVLSFTMYTALWLGFMVTTALLLYNSVGFYRREMYATQSLLYALSGGAIAPAVILAAIPWGAICVVGILVTVGYITYCFATGSDPLTWLDREIARLSAACPLFGRSTLGWTAWLECRSMLSALRTVYWGIVIAGVVTLINILVFLGPLSRGLPSGPLPPPPF